MLLVLLESCSDIRCLQGSKKLLVGKHLMARSGRDVSDKIKSGMRLSADALEFVHEATQDFRIRYLEDAKYAATHSDRAP